MATLTSANSKFTLIATNVFPVPQNIKGFATDEMIDTEQTDLAEVLMGVDGRKSAGYVPAVVTQTFTLQADSPSIKIMDAIIAYTKTTREVVELDGTFSVPATGRSYTLTNGTLTKVSQIPGAKKILQPQKYTIVWESADPAVI